MDEMTEMILMDAEEKMEKSIETLKRDFVQVRTGRASAATLDLVFIDYYGVKTPVKQVASITVPEANQLLIKPFDKGTLKDIEHAINVANLGIAPQNDGTSIRLIFPKLTEERRREMTKNLGKYEESAKVAIRNIRRDANEEIKKLDLPEDEEKGNMEDVQKLTDKYVALVSSLTEEKTKELMTV